MIDDFFKFIKGFIAKLAGGSKNIATWIKQILARLKKWIDELLSPKKIKKAEKEIEIEQKKLNKAKKLKAKKMWKEFEYKHLFKVPPTKKTLLFGRYFSFNKKWVTNY